MIWPFKKKCDHVWKIMDKHIEPAHLKQNGVAKMDMSGEAALALFTSTYICILACEKCGAINKTVEKV